MLFILDRAGDPVKKDAPPGAVKILKAEKRLQALDFWVRNPDYLAHEYLERFEESGRKDISLLNTAAEIMRGDEPEIRRLGMLRFMFGAFEAVDTALSILVMHSLAAMRRNYSSDGRKVKRTDYYLLQQGQQEASKLASNELLSWYADRAAKAAFIAADLSGNDLKKRQYAVPEYGEQSWGRVIPPIEGKVRERLESLLGKTA